MKLAFAASGLWLILSLILLFGGQSAFGNGVIGDTGILMMTGLLALIVASYSSREHRLVQIFSGMVLGWVLIAIPLYIRFAEKILDLNAGIIGGIMVSVALYEGYYSDQWHIKY